jgi:YVTN family beta-propeller protein
MCLTRNSTIQQRDIFTDSRPKLNSYLKRRMLIRIHSHNDNLGGALSLDRIKSSSKSIHTPFTTPLSLSLDSFLYLIMVFLLFTGSQSILYKAEGQQLQQPIGSTVPVGLSPFGIAFNPQNGNVYITNFYSNSISVLDEATNNVITTIPLETNTYPAGIAYNPENGNLYVSNYYAAGSSLTGLTPGSVFVIDGSNNTVIDTIEVGASPLAIEYNPDNGNLYVTNFYPGTISVINGTTNVVTDTIPAALQGPIGIEHNPDNGDLYITNFYSGIISIIDSETNSISDTISGILYPYQIIYNPDNGNAYVTSPVASSVYVINASDNEIAGSIPSGFQPLGIAHNPGNGDVYVANYNSNSSMSGSVSVIDESTNSVIALAPTGGSGSSGVAFNPANSNVYVANWFSQTVSVIPTDELLQFQQLQQQQPLPGQISPAQPTLTQQPQPPIQQPQQYPAPNPLGTAIASAVDRNGNPVSNGGSTSSTTIQFTFSLADATGTRGSAGPAESTQFECSLNGNDYSLCIGPVTY